MTKIPDKPRLEGLEAKWDAVWDADGTYRFDRSKSSDEIYSIDTPPPTVSGSLHMGSVFGYAQTDSIARYRRMRGWEVYYPMGWDDNGLPTERRVQNYFGVRCDPSLPFDPDFTPPDAGAKRGRPTPISRPNFVALCHRLTAEDETAFEQLWRRLGLSVDWTQTYATIDDHSRRVSQVMFLRNLRRGEAYQAEAPTLWDVDFQTAVAQAELEDREVPGAYHRLRFDDVLIDTTRPELLPACVALVAHPDDERYRARIGTYVRTPLLGVKIPICAHELADPEKGTGIAMVCTFGDVADVTWWRELDLPVRSIVGRDGRIAESPPPGVPSNEAWAALAGSSVTRARATIVELLGASGDLVGEPRPVSHLVKFYEKGDRPLEIVSSRQWYIRNGGRDDELRQALLDRGGELAWHPRSMKVRYDNWVEGLTGDWLIGRQRYFGVSIPVFYPLDDAGVPDWDNPVLPPDDMLPVDPTTDVPPGYDESQRGQPGGFVGESDVMDTWATSSLTPYIATRHGDDDDLHRRTFPMALRPQGPEIIRTWLFSSIVRGHFEDGRLPWDHTTINGWVLDPDRKKMSKSKGNVVTPVEYFDRFGSDAVRYWAMSGRPGVDTAFDEGQIKVGRRLAIKILNASKFVLGVRGDVSTDAVAVTQALDRSLLHTLATLVDEATAALDEYDYARALERTERFFWAFCDDYLELVKQRAYGGNDDDRAASARRTLELALSTLLLLFAPHLPFVTEEVWSWWQEASVHTAPWPAAAEIRTAAHDAGPLGYEVAAAVLGEVRKAKTNQQRSMRAEVEHVVVRDTAERLAALALVVADVCEAGRVQTLEPVEAEDFAVEVELAEPDAA